MVFDLAFEALFLGLSLELLLILGLVVALVLGLEYVGNELKTDVFGVGVVLLHPFPVQLLHLLPQGFLHYFLVVDPLVYLFPLPLLFGPQLSLPGLFHQFVLQVLLLQSSLPLELLVVVVYFLVLAVHLPVLGPEVAVLHSLVDLLQLLVPQFAHLLLLVLLPQLQVQSVHHFSSEVAGLLDVLLLRLHADLQVVAGVSVAGPGFSSEVVDVFLVDVFPVDVPLSFFFFLALPLGLGFLCQLLGE